MLDFESLGKGKQTGTSSTDLRPDSGAHYSERPRKPDAPDGAVQALVIGEIVGNYQVRGLLGQGGMGQVYRARDTMLGRSVALKVVRRERVGSAGSERFVEEAKMLGILNHPHIVQLYHAGVHQGNPYLALEYVDGKTLQDRGCACSQDEALRFARAIADALAHAHQRGVMHCDLKPSNVLVGHDGRLRVVDFGLARRVSGTPVSPEGTPEWMAPEQWQGHVLTDRVDIWALAVVLLKLLGRPHPFALLDTSLRERLLDERVPPVLAARGALPSQIDELLERSLEREPSWRPSARDWVNALDNAIAGRDLPASGEGPYRGLASFDEEHARDFFGRDAEIDAFLERLRTVTLLPVVGPSGVGKSSFVHAGVVPRLRARGNWTVLLLRPGAFPIEALARRLLAAGHSHNVAARARDQSDATTEVSLVEPEVRLLAEELRITPALLALRLATLASATRGGVVLLVDQLEELFTNSAPATDVAQLLTMLLQAADDPKEDIRVIVTVRDDFVGRFAGLRELFVMRPLGPKDLRLAITCPLRRTGSTFDDPAIVDDMLAELGTSSTSDLPLLQFACRALWDGRDVVHSKLLRTTYDQIGGVAGALARHADGVIAGMTTADLGVTRQVFLRLLVGTARRTVVRRDLEAELPAAGRVLDQLVSSRLVVQRTSLEGSSVVEIAHEALLRSWSTLQHWIDDTRDERRLIAELEEASTLWHRRGSRPEETWPVEDTAATRHRFAVLGLEAPPSIEEFLAAAELRHRALRRRNRNRLAIVGITALAVTTLAILLAGEYRRQKLLAESARGNLGQLELELNPFDWTGERDVPVDPTVLPALSWRVFSTTPGDEHTPGSELPAALIHRLGTTVSNNARIDRAKLPGGSAFLRLDGRGRSGESCAPSWIRILSLPGYATHEQITRIKLNVPTCSASAAGLLEIESGPFIYGGPGDPPTASRDELDPEEEIDVPAFAIDRTEVSNAQFKPFARMRELTGYAVPDYPATALHKDAGKPDRPVTSVDGFEAEAFCRYMGKRLPGDHEWAKAARGGLIVRGVTNPFPRRLFPWGVERKRCANTADPEDGYRWVAPIDALLCGASPYGVLNLAGNVSEWISRKGQIDRARNPLWVVRGGEVMSPPELDQATTVFRNERQGRQFTFALGFRCVRGEELP